MVGIELFQHDLNNYYKIYVDYTKNKEKYNLDENLNYTIEFFDIDGLKFLLSNFTKLTKRKQIRLLFFIKKMKISILCNDLYNLAFSKKNLVHDEYIRRLLIKTIWKISDERYSIFVFERLKNTINQDIFIELLKSIRIINKRQVIKLFIQFKLLLDKNKDHGFLIKFKKYFFNLIRYNKLKTYLDSLCINSTDFYSQLVEKSEAESELFNKIISEMIHLTLDVKKEILNIVKTNYAKLYPYIIKNKSTLKFSDYVVKCFKSFNSEMIKTFSLKFSDYIKESEKQELLYIEFLKLMIEFDEHKIEDKLINEINEEIKVEVSKRNNKKILMNTRILIHKPVLNHIDFESKIFNIIFPELNNNKIMIEFIAYLNRKKIKPNEKILKFFFENSSIDTTELFIDYFCNVIDQFSSDTVKRLDEFIETKKATLSLTVLFKFYSYRKKLSQAVDILKEIFSNGTSDEKLGVLVSLKGYNNIDILRRFKTFISAIVNNPTIEAEIKSKASEIMLKILDNDIDKTVDFIKNLNSFSITIFFDCILNDFSEDKVIDILYRFLDTDNIILRNYIFNNLKHIRNCEIDEKFLNKVITAITSESLYCFEVIVFLLNNNYSIESFKSSLEEKISSMKDTFNKMFLILLLKKSFDYSKRLDEIKNNFIEFDISYKQLEEIYFLSHVSVFDRDTLNILLKVKQNDIKFIVLKNLFINHKNSIFNVLLTALRLEENFSIQKFIISVISMDFNLQHMKPMINILTPKKKQLANYIFSLFSTYPYSFLMSILYDEEKKSENKVSERKYLNNVRWTIDNLVNSK